MPVWFGVVASKVVMVPAATTSRVNVYGVPPIFSEKDAGPILFAVPLKTHFINPYPTNKFVAAIFAVSPVTPVEAIACAETATPELDE